MIVLTYAFGYSRESSNDSAWIAGINSLDSLLPLLNTSLISAKNEILGEITLNSPPPPLEKFKKSNFSKVYPEMAVKKIRFIFF